MSEATTTCITCGSKVKIISSDEGTHYYEPIEAENERKRILEIVDEMFDENEKFNKLYVHNNSTGWLPPFHGATLMVLRKRITEIEKRGRVRIVGIPDFTGDANVATQHYESVEAENERKRILEIVDELEDKIPKPEGSLEFGQLSVIATLRERIAKLEEKNGKV
jgi:hypothetical protein